LDDGDDTLSALLPSAISPPSLLIAAPPLLTASTVVEGSSSLDTSPPSMLTLGAGTLADVLSSGVLPPPLGTTSHALLLFPSPDGALLYSV